MTNQTERDTDRTGADSGTSGGLPDTPPDFSGWDRAQWRAYRRAQKQAYREAKWRERGRAWENISSERDGYGGDWPEGDWSQRDWPGRRESDPLGAVTWAVIFVWAGIVLLANNLGWLDVWISRFPATELGIQRFSLGAFSIVFLGVALILLGEVALRLVAPPLYRPVLGTLILAAILLGVGLDGVIAWNIVWPVILILLGAYIILGGVLRRNP